MKFKINTHYYLSFFVAALICFKANAQSCDTCFRKNEFGIDITNTLSFLKKNSQSYLLNYWYSPNRKTSFRFGLNLDVGDGESDGIYPSVKLGIQKNKRELFWNFYYGVDISYTYYKSNAQPTDISRFGISPLIGVEYFSTQKFSLATEISLNYYAFKERNQDTFDPIKEKQYYRLVIGSVGMFIIKYHF